MASNDELTECEAEYERCRVAFRQFVDAVQNTEEEEKARRELFAAHDRLLAARSAQRHIPFHSDV